MWGAKMKSKTTIHYKAGEKLSGKIGSWLESIVKVKRGFWNDVSKKHYRITIKVEELSK